jgi:hypothetical protein
LAGTWFTCRKLSAAPFVSSFAVCLSGLARLRRLKSNSQYARMRNSEGEAPGWGTENSGAPESRGRTHDPLRLRCLGRCWACRVTQLPWGSSTDCGGGGGGWAATGRSAQEMLGTPLAATFVDPYMKVALRGAMERMMQGQPPGELSVAFATHAGSDVSCALMMAIPGNVTVRKRVRVVGVMVSIVGATASPSPRPPLRPPRRPTNGEKSSCESWG